MNITIGNTNNDSSKRIKLRFIAAASAVALAVTLGIGGATAVSHRGAGEAFSVNLVPAQTAVSTFANDTAAEYSAREAAQIAIAAVPQTAPLYDATAPLFGSGADADSATHSLAPIFQMPGSQTVSAPRSTAADADYATHSFAPVVEMPRPETVSAPRDLAADAAYATHSFAPIFQMPRP